MLLLVSWNSCIESINDTYYYRLSSSEVKTYFPNVSIKYNFDGKDYEYNLDTLKGKVQNDE